MGRLQKIVQLLGAKISRWSRWRSIFPLPVLGSESRNSISSPSRRSKKDPRRQFVRKHQGQRISIFFHFWTLQDPEQTGFRWAYVANRGLWLGAESNRRDCHLGRFAGIC
jgi:hypothetical protein